MMKSYDYYKTILQDDAFLAKFFSNDEALNKIIRPNEEILVPDSELSEEFYNIVDELLLKISSKSSQKKLTRIIELWSQKLNLNVEHHYKQGIVDGLKIFIAILKANNN